MDKTILKTSLASLLLVSAQPLLAQTAEQPDTLSGITLAEVEIKGSTVIDKSDRKLLLPTTEQTRMSSNGVDLLRNMQVPTLTIDIVNDQIKLLGNGNLTICVNGKEATINDVKALDPRSVKRIEYHESPSIRYGEADAVIDYIVEHPSSGGSFMANAQQAYATAWGNFNASGKMNSGNSQFGFYGYFGERQNFSGWRDNTERYLTEDGQAFSRTEKGEPGEFTVPWYNAAFDYSYSRSDEMLFVAQAKIFGTPHQQIEYNGCLTNSYTESQQSVSDVQKEMEYRPAIDLYWQRNLKGNQSLMLNAVGSYAYSQSDHSYFATHSIPSGMDDVSLLTSIASRSYSLIANANYEKRWSAGRLTAGVRYTQAWGDNDYRTSQLVEKTRESKTLFYSEWWQPAGNWLDYTLSLAGKQRAFRIVGSNPTSTFDVITSLKIRIRPASHHTLRLEASTSTDSPGANDLTSALQDLDEFQKYRGNPNLKPYRNVRAKLQYEFTKGIFFGRLKASYDYYKNPVMEDKYWVTENGSTFLLNTKNNQRNMQQMQILATIRTEAIPGWLTIAGNVGWGKQISNGHRYEHRHGHMIANWDIMLTHWNFTLTYSGSINEKWLWGETVNGSENYQIVMLNYKRKDWNFGIGVVNPFMKNYNTPSENLNRYASYYRESHIDMAENLGFLSIAYNIQWGRKNKALEKRLNNSYDGGTVGTTGK